MVRHRDLAHLLSSNTVPKPLEVVSIQLGIESITTKILQIQSQLSELEEELRAHRAVLSPVRKLPLEILGEIFGLVVDPPLDRDGRSQLLDLCLVCKTWRDAAVLTHRLWSRVSTVEYPMPFKKITDWLSRSGSIPRSFEVIADGRNDCTDVLSACKYTTVALAKMLTDGPNLDHLSLDYSGPQYFRNLVEALHLSKGFSESRTRPWDTVRSLSLKFRTFWNEPPNPSASSFLHIPSSVTSFHLHLPPLGAEGIPRSMATTPLHLPPDLLQRLTSLTIHCDWDGLQVSTALMHCQNVEELTLSFDGLVQFTDLNNPSSGSFSRSEIVLPKLRTLRFRSLSPHNLDVFSFLTAPVLNALDIHFSIEDAEDRLDSGQFDFTQNIHEFIKKRSKCEDTFRSLSIRSAYSTAWELIQLVEGLPSITNLTFADIDYADDDSILFYYNRPTGLPRLETLELLDVSRPDFFFQGLINFVKSRQPPPSKDGRTACDQPPDSLKQLVLTYRPEAHVLEHGHDVSENVERLRRVYGVSVDIGPLSFSNA
ncbi:hypothetical protein H1R20_g12479, partial [Candolleomyces eurysporus]